MEIRDILYLVGLLISLAGLGLGSMRHTASQITKVKEEGEAARARMYARFDEYKKETEERTERNYVRKDIHDLNIRRIETDITEIKLSTAFLPAINVKLNMLLARNGLNEDGSTKGTGA